MCNHMQSFTAIFNHMQPFTAIFNHIQLYVRDERRPGSQETEADMRKGANLKTLFGDIYIQGESKYWIPSKTD